MLEGHALLDKVHRHTFLMLAADATPERPWSCAGEGFVFKLREIGEHPPIPKEEQEVTQDIDHASRDHAQLGASSCSRWWNCPGCFHLQKSLGTKGHTSIYAMEGTAAHQLGHMC